MNKLCSQHGHRVHIGGECIICIKRERDELCQDRERIQNWVIEGEQLFGKEKSVMFSVGVWWGERPWRKKN